MLSHKLWRAEAVIQFIAGVTACVCLGAVISGLLQQSGLAAFKSPNSLANVALATMSFQGATWVLMLIFLRRHQVGLLDALGLKTPGWGKSLLRAGGVLLLALPFIWLLQNLSLAALMKLGVPLENERAIGLLLDAKSVWLQVYLGVFAVLLAPVAEEFIFRGMLYPFVKQLGSPRLAFFGVSALFALIHFDLALLLPLFALALLLTWIYEKTDCLLASMTAHALFNGVNLAALYFAEPLGHWLLKHGPLFHRP